MMPPDQRATPEFLLSKEWYGILASLLRQEGSLRIEGMFEIFATLLRAGETMLLHLPVGTDPVILAHRTSRPSREQQLNDWKNVFYLSDPFYLAIERAAEEQAISLRDIVDEYEFAASDFYVRHYSETDLTDELCYCVPDGGDGYLLLSFARFGDVGRYDKDELDLAKAMSPMVVTVLASNWMDMHGSPAAGTRGAPRRAQGDLNAARENFGRSMLTEREFEVVQMMLRGYPIDMTANRLNMAEGTAKVHRRNIYRKLDVNSTAQLFALFIDVVSEIEISPSVDPLVDYDRLGTRQA